MMVTAVLVFTLAAAEAPFLQVHGPSRCPTASEVAALLPELLPPGEKTYSDVAWIEAAGLDLQVELRSPAGEVLFSRRLTSHGSCADLANVAAVVIASWTADRHPDISLLQPGVAVPAAASHSRPASASAAPVKVEAPAPPRRRRDFDLSLGLGTSANSAGFVGAGRVEVGVRGRRLGLRAGFSAETARDQAVDLATVSWRRCGLSLGPSFTLVEDPLVLDARGEIFAGITTVAGHGLDVNRQSTAVAPGLAVALRLGAAGGWIRPWIELGAQYWLAEQEISVTREQQSSTRVPLTRLEARLLAGISLVLSR